MSTRYQQLADGNSDGTILGQSASDPVSLYGVVPVVQAAHLTIVNSGESPSLGCASIASVVSTAMYAASQVNKLITALTNLGILAAS